MSELIEESRRKVQYTIVSLPEHWAALIMGMANAIRFIFFPLEQLVYPWSYSLNDAIFLVVT